MLVRQLFYIAFALSGAFAAPNPAHTKTCKKMSKPPPDVASDLAAGGAGGGAGNTTTTTPNPPASNPPAPNPNPQPDAGSGAGDGSDNSTDTGGDAGNNTTTIPPAPPGADGGNRTGADAGTGNGTTAGGAGAGANSTSTTSNSTSTTQSSLAGDGFDSITVQKPTSGECATVPEIKTSYVKQPSVGKRFVAYASAWHGALGAGDTKVLPSSDQLESLTHVVLSFVHIGQERHNPNNQRMPFDGFITSENIDWDKKPNKTDTAEALRAVNPKVKVIAALGGWALDDNFRDYAANETSRQGFADQIANFVQEYALDGIDLDWEYPVWFGQTWKTTRPIDWCDRTNNVLMTAAIRESLLKLEAKTQKKYEISVALPAKPQNMLAYDEETIPQLEKVVDAWGLMSYDFVNRRDFIMGHHSGTGVAKVVVDEYKKRGMTPSMMEVGVAMYAKWFNVTSVPNTNATAASHIGSSMGEWTFENQTDGADLNMAGAYLFNDTMMLGELATRYNGPSWGDYSAVLDPSWKAAKANPAKDAQAGASSYFDEQNKIFWTWTDVEESKRMCEDWIGELGGVMTWALNQDEAGAPRFKALAECVQKAGGGTLPPAGNVTAGNGTAPAGNSNTTGVPPAGNSTSEAPPSGNTTIGVPPPNNATTGVPPPNDPTTGVPPPNDSTTGPPPSGNSTSSVPPSGNGTPQVPPPGNSTSGESTSSSPPPKDGFEE